MYVTSPTMSVSPVSDLHHLQRQFHQAEQHHHSAISFADPLEVSYPRSVPRHSQSVFSQLHQIKDYKKSPSSSTNSTDSPPARRSTVTTSSQMKVSNTIPSLLSSSNADNSISKEMRALNEYRRLLLQQKKQSMQTELFLHFRIIIAFQCLYGYWS